MKITNAAQLQEAITLLQAQSMSQKEDLAAHFNETYEKLRPTNLIKNAFNKIIDIGGMADHFIGKSVGAGAGVLSKKILVGKSSNIFKRVLGTVVELAVATVVTKNSDGMKDKAFGLIKKLIK